MTFFIYFIVSVTRSVIFFVLSLCLLLSLLLVFQWLCAALFFQIFIHISLVYSTRNKTNLELLQFFFVAAAVRCTFEHELQINFIIKLCETNTHRHTPHTFYLWHFTAN